MCRTSLNILLTLGASASASAEALDQPHIEIFVNDLVDKLLDGMLQAQALPPQTLWLPSRVPISFQNSRLHRSTQSPLVPRLPMISIKQFGRIFAQDSKELEVSSIKASLPAYSTLDEFLECSLANRHESHATPIRSVEFDILRAICDEPGEDWMVSLEEPGVKIEQKYTEYSDCILVRAFMDFPGVEPDVVLYNMIDFKAREAWDNIQNFESVEEAVQGSDLLYFMVPTPPVVRNRDFVVYKRIQSETSAQGCGYSLVFRSTSRDSKPLVENTVRGEIHFDGNRMHRANGSKTTRFSVASMSDPGGRLPLALANRFVVTKLYQNMDKLRIASERMQADVSLDPKLRMRISEVTGKFQQRTC